MDENAQSFHTSVNFTRYREMKFDLEITVAGRKIDADSPVYIIAEAGVNHGGDMEKAKQLVDVAVEAGADAVKFQAFRTENLILQSVSKAPYQTKTTEASESQYEMLKRLEVTKEQNQELLAYCKSRDIQFLTTPFDSGSLIELDELELPAYKIASTDLTNLPFLAEVAERGKPIFLSTGMSYGSEVEAALQEILPINKQVVLLACTANYPISDDEANLNTIRNFLDAYEILVGYSDHTVGIGASPYAVPMGAKVVEKHFTLDKDASGPDHRASLSPDELKLYVKEIRKVETYLGRYEKAPTTSEFQTRKSLQKNLVAKVKINKGELLSLNNMIAKRTGGDGISPLHYKDLVGKPAITDFEPDDIITV